MALAQTEYLKAEIQQFENAILRLERYGMNITEIKVMVSRGKRFYLEKIEETKSMLEQQSNEILQKISSLEGIDREVIYLRYVKQKKWCEIEIDTSWSYSQLHRIHKRALGKLIEMYGEGIKDEISNAS